MTQKDFARVLLKVYGLYWGGCALLSLRAVFYQCVFGKYPPDASLASIVIEFSGDILLYMIPCLLLIYKTDFIIRVLGITDEGVEADTRDAPKREGFLSALAFSAAGCYMFTVGCENAFQTFFKYLQEVQMFGGVSKFTVGTNTFARYWPPMATSLFQVLLGCLLIVGVNAFIRYWRKARNLGTVAETGSDKLDNGTSV